MSIQESILLYFQGIGTPFLDFLFEIVTMLGEKNILIAGLAWIFWNIDKKKGFILSYTLLFSIFLNALIKISFHRPRPFEQISEISAKRVHTATGYAFPSGHTQGAATFYMTIALLFKKKWIYVAAVLLSLLVALSRVYLGVHWPVDVIGGLITGAFVSIVMYLILNSLYDNTKQRDRFVLISSFAVVFVLFVFIAVNMFCFKGKFILTDMVKTVGVFTGASIGFILEEKVSPFVVTGSLIKKILRFIIGLIFTLVLLSGLKLILPPADIFHFIRYGLTGLWITWLFPLLGMKVRLFR